VQIQLSVLGGHLISEFTLILPIAARLASGSKRSGCAIIGRSSLAVEHKKRKTSPGLPFLFFSPSDWPTY
jgi:hypothetical protein